MDLKLSKKHYTLVLQVHVMDLALFLFGPLNLDKKWSYKKKFISYSAALSTKNNIPIFLNINSHDPSHGCIKS